MALDLTGENLYPIVKTFTANQTATEIILPRTCLTVTIGSETHQIYWSNVGIDGQSLSQHKDFIDGGAKLSVKLGRGSNRTNAIYIETKSAASATVSLVFEE